MSLQSDILYYLKGRKYKKRRKEKMKTIDWNSVPDSQFEVLPEGEYVGKIIECTETTSRAGDEMWKVRIQVKGTKTSIFTNLVFMEKMLFNIKHLYQAIFGENDMPSQIDSQQLIGKIVGFNTKHTEYNGQKQSNIVLGSWFQPNISDLTDDEVNYPPIKSASEGIANTATAVEEDPFA